MHTSVVSRDSLDQVRGVLFALANRGGDFFTPISTLAIRFALARRNREIAPAQALASLHQIGDVQGLGHGFWLPVRVTAVPCGSIYLLASGMPTSALEHEYSCAIVGRGFSRLTSESDAVRNIPSQSFERWCRAPASSQVWTESLLRSARLAEIPRDQTIEYLNHWEAFPARRWIVGETIAGAPDGFVLARVKSRLRTIYFLSRVLKSRPEGLQELTTDWSDAFRVGIGLRTIANNHPQFSVENDDQGGMLVILPRFIPREEQMVLRAIGATDELEGANLMKATIPMEAWPAIEKMLCNLGLSRRG